MLYIVSSSPSFFGCTSELLALRYIINLENRVVKSYTLITLLRNCGVHLLNDLFLKFFHSNLLYLCMIVSLSLTTGWVGCQSWMARQPLVPTPLLLSYLAPCNQPHDISSCIQIFSYLSIGKSHNDNLPEHGIGFTNCTGLASTQLYTVRFGLHG